MLYDQAVGMVMQALGGLESLRPQIKDNMEYVKVFELERNPTLRPWFLYSKSVVAVAAEAMSVAVPTTLLAEWEYGFVRFEGDKDFYKKLNAFQEAAASETTLKGFVRYGANIQLIAPVVEAGNFEFHGYYQSEVLTASVNDNPWLLYGADLLIALTAARMCIMANDNESATVQLSIASIAKARLQAETIEYFMGNIT